MFGRGEIGTLSFVGSLYRIANLDRWQFVWLHGTCIVQLDAIFYVEYNLLKCYDMNLTCRQRVEPLPILEYWSD